MTQDFPSTRQTSELMDSWTHLPIELDIRVVSFATFFSICPQRGNLKTFASRSIDKRRALVVQHDPSLSIWTFPILTPRP